MWAAVFVVAPFGAWAVQLLSLLRLYDLSPLMQQGFGVAVGLLQTLEHQVAGRLVSRRRIDVAGHGWVQGIAGVFTIAHCRHALHGFCDSFFIDDALQ